MANFMGGSAPAMASQIVEGYILLSSATIRGYLPADLNLLRAEMEKALREVRATVPPQDDAMAAQARNRKIGRLSSALQVIGAALTNRR
jgi:hypothetical protein